jgi:hypothetical protein
MSERMDSAIDSGMAGVLGSLCHAAVLIIVATGEVYHLNSLQNMSGNYGAASAGATN